MHNIDLGVTKKKLLARLNDQCSIAKVSPLAIRTINERYLSFQSQMSSDFVRRPRSLKDIHSFNANEFRQIMLYLIPVLFKNIISPELYKRTLNLHAAILILLKNTMKHMALKTLLSIHIDCLLHIYIYI